MTVFTRTCIPPPYPEDHYQAQAVHDGEWGNLTRCPADWDTIIEAIGVMFDERPPLTMIRVWHFQEDVPPRDATEDVMNKMEWPEYDPAEDSDYLDARYDRMRDDLASAWLA